MPAQLDGKDRTDAKSQKTNKRDSCPDIHEDRQQGKSNEHGPETGKTLGKTGGEDDEMEVDVIGHWLLVIAKLHYPEPEGKSVRGAAPPTYQ
jgi:hypothetical protein